MKPTKELIEQWANQAHEEVTNADVSRAGGSTRIAVNIRVAQLAAQWGYEQAQQTTADLPPFGSKRKAAMAVYAPPFKYEHGYIFDSNRHMVADQGGCGEKNTVEGAVGARVRGWGRLGYMPNGAELQDEIGQMLADALNELYAGVRAGMATVKESLTTGKQRLQVPTGWAAPKDQYAVPVLFNPYTGEPRDVRDVQSDPQGILIVPPGKVNQLAAMQGGQQP